MVVEKWFFQNQFNPHIVQVYGCILDEKQSYGILMEYCEGGSLHDYIQDKHKLYEKKDIIRWTFHASSGLLYLHENKIVHKDVKPKKSRSKFLSNKTFQHAFDKYEVENL